MLLKSLFCLCWQAGRHFVCFFFLTNLTLGKSKKCSTDQLCMTNLTWLEWQMALKEQFVTTEILEMEHTKIELNHDLKNQPHPARKKKQHFYR